MQWLALWQGGEEKLPDAGEVAGWSCWEGDVRLVAALVKELAAGVSCLRRKNLRWRGKRRD
jgi:hypothetical protein